MRLYKLCVSLIVGLVSSVATANVIGTDSQNFNTTTDGLDFVTVQSSKTLDPGIINFGLFFNYAVNTLPYFEANPDNRSSYNDSLLESDLNFGVGILPKWDAGLSLPAVLSQSVANPSAIGGSFSSYGNTEVRPNTKYRFLGNDTSGLALIASANFNRIQNNPYSGLGGGPTLNLEMAGDRRFGDFQVGLNVGYRWRQPGSQIPGIPIAPFGNQFIYSGAANYLIPHSDTKMILEIFGANATQTSNYADQGRSQDSLEALLGMKHDFTTHLAFHAGFGTELADAIASPDWRVYTGITYAIGPVWGGKKERNLEPVEPPPAPAQEAFVAHNILFEFNSDELNPDSQKTLGELVEYLHKAPFTKLTVEGHTDSVGSETYNMNLSQRRADSIKKYLVDHYGVNEAQIEAIGYGPTRPIADNGNYQGRQQNRRVEFKIDR